MKGYCDKAMAEKKGLLDRKEAGRHGLTPCDRNCSSCFCFVEITENGHFHRPGKRTPVSPQRWTIEEIIDEYLGEDYE